MLDFTLTLAGGGWADAYLREGEAEHIFTASYLHDGLEEFLATINGLFHEPAAECWWEQEPGELRWRFARNGNTLEVNAEYPPEEKYENYCFEPGDEYIGTTDFLLFARQVEASYRQMLAVWGGEGYASKNGWGYPFPHQQLANLTANLSTL
jgi:hypothetical protein